VHCKHYFYLITFILARNHLTESPKAKYLTNNGACRFDPNLYVDGTVCLSILGTWNGLGWMPATIECIGHPIRAWRLINHRLFCEPGTRGPPEEITQSSQFVEKWSLEFSLIYAIESTPAGFEEFRPHLTRTSLHVQIVTPGPAGPGVTEQLEK
jgi:baculoviral IAP repeat-containing protein 6